MSLQRAAPPGRVSGRRTPAPLQPRPRIRAGPGAAHRPGLPGRCPPPPIPDRPGQRGRARAAVSRSRAHARRRPGSRTRRFGRPVRGEASRGTTRRGWPRTRALKGVGTAGRSRIRPRQEDPGGRVRLWKLDPEGPGAFAGGLRRLLPLAPTPLGRLVPGAGRGDGSGRSPAASRQLPGFRARLRRLQETSAASAGAVALDPFTGVKSRLRPKFILSDFNIMTRFSRVKIDPRSDAARERVFRTDSPGPCPGGARRSGRNARPLGLAAPASASAPGPPASSDARS